MDDATSPPVETAADNGANRENPALRAAGGSASCAFGALKRPLVFTTATLEPPSVSQARLARLVRMDLLRAACRVGPLTLAFVVAAATPSLALPPVQDCVHVSPGPGDSVPANAPALLTVKVVSGPATSGPVIDRISLRVFGPGGEVALEESPDPFTTPGSPPAVLVRPASPVTPGQYRLQYQALCAAGTRMASFTVTDPVPLPTSLGSLSLADQRLSRACPPSRHALEIATVKLAIAPEMRPFLPVMVLHGSFDGVPVDARHPGSPFSHAYGELERDETNFFFAAGCRDAGDARYFAPGKHEIVFQAQIAGATASPTPARITLDFTCPGLDQPLTAEEQATCMKAQEQVPSLDAGPRADAASALDAAGAPHDAGAASAPRPRSSRGGGCSLAAADGRPSLAALVLSVMLAVSAAGLRTRRAGEKASSRARRRWYFAG
jgi:hypothetical protein